MEEKGIVARWCPGSRQRATPRRRCPAVVVRHGGGAPRRRRLPRSPRRGYPGPRGAAAVPRGGGAPRPRGGGALAPGHRQQGSGGRLSRATIPFTSMSLFNLNLSESKPKFLSSNSFSTMAEITPTTILVKEVPGVCKLQQSLSPPPCCHSVCISD